MTHQLYHVIPDLFSDQWRIKVGRALTTPFQTQTAAIEAARRVARARWNRTSRPSRVMVHSVEGRPRVAYTINWLVS